MSIQNHVDLLVPDPQIAREFGVSLVSLYRWDHDARKLSLGWPPAIRSGNPVRGRKYRSRAQIEKFKQNVLAEALKQRGRRKAAPAAAEAEA